MTDGETLRLKIRPSFDSFMALSLKHITNTTFFNVEHDLNDVTTFLHTTFIQGGVLSYDVY
jgi:hypothetical protein